MVLGIHNRGHYMAAKTKRKRIMNETTPNDSKMPDSKSDSMTFNANTARKNRRIAIAMMVVFIAPVLVAYVLLKTGIYQNFGTSNKGTLLDPPQLITDQPWLEYDLEVLKNPLLKKTINQSWWLAYEMPAECNMQCEQRLLQIRQSLQALGPDQQRVRPLIITHSESDTKTLSTWRKQVDLIGTNILQVRSGEKTQGPGITQTSFHTKGNTLPSGGLYIVDPMGFIMLYYAPAETEKGAIGQAKSLVRDLKYLLKVSRIG